MFHSPSPTECRSRAGSLTDHLYGGRSRTGSMTEAALPSAVEPRRKSVHFSTPLVTDVQEIPDSASMQRPLTIDTKYFSADRGWLEVDNQGKEVLLHHCHSPHAVPSFGFIGLLQVADGHTPERPKMYVRQSSVERSMPISVRSYVGLRKNCSSHMLRVDN